MKTLIALLTLTASVNAFATDCDVYPEQAMIVGEIFALDKDCVAQVRLVYVGQHAECPFNFVSDKVSMKLTPARCKIDNRIACGILKKDLDGNVTLEH